MNTESKEAEIDNSIDQEGVMDRYMLVAADKNLSNRGLAKALDVSSGVIQNISTKKIQKVNPIYIKALCDTFNVNKSWLLYGLGEMYLTQDDQLSDLVLKLLAEGNDSQKKIFTELGDPGDWTEEELEYLLNTIRMLKKTRKNTT